MAIKETEKKPEPKPKNDPAEDEDKLEEDHDEEEVFSQFGVDDPDDQVRIRHSAAARVLAARRLERLHRKQQPPKEGKSPKKGGGELW